MIRPLRSCHRFLVTALAVVVPAVFLAALAARPPEPAMERLPAVLAPGTADLGADSPAAREPAASWQALWPGLPLTTELHRLEAGGYRVALSPREPLAAPDLLLYWSPGKAAEEGALPDDARLVGSVDGVAGGSYPLPAAGTLHLYSLGHQRLLGRAQIELPAGSAGAPDDTPDDGA